MIQCDGGGAMAAIGSVPSAWAMVGTRVEYRLTRDRPQHDSTMLWELLPVVIARAVWERHGGGAWSS